MGLLDFIVGKKPAMPNAPQFQLPSWAGGLPPEILGLIRGQVGQQLPMPGEFDVASSALQNILNYQPEQFQFPMEEIQQALAAQQAQQMQQWQQQINPLLAARGQFDSTTRENMLSQFLQGQQAQTYGTTADLLTQQALQNLQLQQYMPQLQMGAAGQLAGLGGQRAGIGQFNLQLPFQTTIPALSGMYGTGLQEAGMRYQAALPQYQAEMGRYGQAAQQRQGLQQMLGGLAGGALLGGIGGLAGAFGTDIGFGGGALRGLMGYNPATAFQMQDLGNILSQQQQTPIRFPFQFGQSNQITTPKLRGSLDPFALSLGSF